MAESNEHLVVVIEQLEAERKEQEKTLTKLGGVFLPVIMAMIAAAIDQNKLNQSGSRPELILLGTSVAFALVSFLVWATILIFVLFKKIEKNILIGSMVIGILSMATGGVLLGVSFWI